MGTYMYNFEVQISVKINLLKITKFSFQYICTWFLITGFCNRTSWEGTCTSVQCNTLVGHAQGSHLKLYSVVCGNKIILVISHIHYEKATVCRCNFIKCFVKFKVYVIKMLFKIKSDKTTWCVGLQNDNYTIH